MKHLRMVPKANVGKCFLAARQGAGIHTIAGAARLLGTQESTLSKIEGGKLKPTYRLLVDCINLYGTTADFLLGMTENIDSDPDDSRERLKEARERHRGARERQREALEHAAQHRKRKADEAKEAMAAAFDQAVANTAALTDVLERINETVPKANAMYAIEGHARVLILSATAAASNFRALQKPNLTQDEAAWRLDDLADSMDRLRKDAETLRESLTAARAHESDAGNRGT